jgi:hypothetical protein
MNSRFLKRAAVAVLAVAALCAPLLFLLPSTEPERSTRESTPAPAMEEIAAKPPQQIPPLPQATPAFAAVPALRDTEPAPPDPSYAPGHFPGVSVRHMPGTHVPTPPEGTERTVPESREVVLPDGRVLIGVTLDETWRVPLKLKTDR